MATGCSPAEAEAEAADVMEEVHTSLEIGGGLSEDSRSSMVFVDARRRTSVLLEITYFTRDGRRIAGELAELNGVR